MYRYLYFGLLHLFPALFPVLFLQKIQAQQGILYHPNPIPDRYFLSPSGLRAQTGDRYFQNTSLICFQSGSTKSNGRSMGWGLVPTFLTGQSTDIPIWLTVAKRWKTRNPKINPWLGGFFLKLPETSVSDTWVFHSGVTFGTGDKNISPGILAGSIEGDELFKGFSLHGQVRLGRKAWLVSENYFLLREASLTPVCLSGFRRNSRSFALELGIGWTKTVRSTLDANPGKAHYVPFPWLGLVFRMPKKPGVLGG